MAISTRLIDGLGALILAAAIALLAGCGGGGGGGGSSGGGTGTSDSGGGAGGGGTPLAANEAAVTVAAGIAGVPNIPTVSVTICAPGSTTNCQTINNIQVDTESFGLRLVAGAASQILGGLPVSTVTGLPLAECGVFADSFTWGSVRTADVQISGERASGVPVQIIGDLSSTPAPIDCQGSGPQISTASGLGANGLLGIGVAPTDCALCAQLAVPAVYYTCNGTLCQIAVVPLAEQVVNPVTKFATDNNGVILQMPAISSNGQSSATGTLIFGIGTQTNNAFTATQRLLTDSSGDVNATLNGVPVQNAFFDSGSNAYFFPGSLSVCSGGAFYCPQSTQTVSAGVQNASGTGAVTTLSLSIANAVALFSGNGGGSFAFNNLGGPGGVLDIGMPFFYGRSMFYGFDRTATGGSAPYVAF